jgi:hypothetical protein
MGSHPTGRRCRCGADRECGRRSLARWSVASCRSSSCSFGDVVPVERPGHFPRTSDRSAGLCRPGVGGLAPTGASVGGDRPVNPKGLAPSGASWLDRPDAPTHPPHPPRRGGNGNCDRLGGRHDALPRSLERSPHHSLDLLTGPFGRPGRVYPPRRRPASVRHTTRRPCSGNRSPAGPGHTRRAKAQASWRTVHVRGADRPLRARSECVEPAGRRRTRPDIDDQLH